MPLPKILVTGFANSGTSFLCELIAAMGYSPGSACYLKGADGHNPYGYWEHLRLRQAVWGRVGNFNARRIPRQPANPMQYMAAPSQIQDIAEQDRVEVYKDCTGPWSYPLLVGLEKVVLIKRGPRVLHRRYYAGRSANHFVEAHTAYHDLAAKYMGADLPTLWVHYEDFFHDTRQAIEQVCEFLERAYDPSLLSVFRPRGLP